jgi:DNA-binding MarR family transcriptional regulator
MSDICNDSGHQIPEINRLIHEPSRYNIMALLYVVEGAEFLFVQHQTNLTPGNLSSHLSKLETAGYIEVKKEFVGKTPRTFLALTPLGRTVFENYRKNMRIILDNLL